MESPFSFCPRWEKNNRNYPLPLSIWLSGFVSWYFLEPLSYPSQEKADLLTQEKRGLVQREQLKSTRPCSPEPKWRTHLTGPRNWEARKQRESAFNAHLPRNCRLKSSVENIFYFIYFFFRFLLLKSARYYFPATEAEETMILCGWTVNEARLST
jgi:hypothetical protein